MVFGKSFAKFKITMKNRLGVTYKYPTATKLTVVIKYLCKIRQLRYLNIFYKRSHYCALPDPITIVVRDSYILSRLRVQTKGVVLNIIFKMRTVRQLFVQSGIGCYRLPFTRMSSGERFPSLSGKRLVSLGNNSTSPTSPSPEVGCNASSKGAA